MTAVLAVDHRAAPPAPPGRSPIAVRRALGRIVVTQHGPLDRGAALILERVLVDLVDGQGNLNVVVELADVPLDDPLALAALQVPAEHARRRGAAFSVLGPTTHLATASSA